MAFGKIPECKNYAKVVASDSVDMSWHALPERVLEVPKFQ